MYIVAGPPGSGKSTVFPVSGFGVASFNADDLAAQLNGGSCQGIPQSSRYRVNRLFESFVNDCIARRASFAVPSHSTRLQPPVARLFNRNHYLALNNVAQQVERVKIRADRGGHSARDRGGQRRCADDGVHGAGTGDSECRPVSAVWVFQLP